MKKLNTFLKAFFAVVFVFLLLAVFTVSAAVADTNTRSITFGDNTPAIGIERYKGQTEIYFFGAVYTVEHSAVNKAVEKTKSIATCFIPSVFRIFDELVKKISG